MADNHIEKPKGDGKPASPSSSPNNAFSKQDVQLDRNGNPRPSFAQNAILSKEKDWVVPPTIDDKERNSMIKRGSYSLYNNPEVADAGFNPDNWPELLKETLQKEEWAILRKIKHMLERDKEHCGPNPTLLDCGCGGGRFLSLACDIFENMIGIDYSDYLLMLAGKEVAQSKGSYGADKTRLILGNMFQMPAITSGSVDVAICTFNTFGGFSEKSQGEMMYQLSRVLKDPKDGSNSFFIFTFYIDEERTKGMQAQFYTNMGLRVISTDCIENGGAFSFPNSGEKEFQTEDFRKLAKDSLGFELAEPGSIGSGRRFTLALGPNGETLTSYRYTKEEMKELVEKSGIFTVDSLTTLLGEQVPTIGAMGLVIAKCGDEKADSTKKFFRALEHKDSERVQGFLSSKGFLNSKDLNGDTPILAAILEERADAAGLLCEAEDRYFRCRSLFWEGKVHEDNLGPWAVAPPDKVLPEVGKWVLGPPPEALRMEYGCDTPMIRAAMSEKPEILDAVAARSFTWSETDRFDRNALHWATIMGRTENALKLIGDEAGGDGFLGASDAYGMTPLMYAVKFGRMDIARALLKAGAGLNFQNENGDTEIAIAAGEGRVEMVKLLLENGADPNKTNYNGSFPLRQAVLRAGEIANMNLERLYVPKTTRKDRADVVMAKDLFENLPLEGKSIFDRNEKLDAVMRALVKERQTRSHEDYVKTAELLINTPGILIPGRESRHVDRFKLNLFCAIPARNGDIPMMKMFIRNYEKISGHPLKHEDLENMIIGACDSNQPKMARFLCKHVHNPNKLNTEERSILMSVVEHGRNCEVSPACIEELIKAGAKTDIRYPYMRKGSQGKMVFEKVRKDAQKGLDELLQNDPKAVDGEVAKSFRKTLEMFAEENVHLLAENKFGRQVFGIEDFGNQTILGVIKDRLAECREKAKTGKRELGKINKLAREEKKLMKIEEVLMKYGATE